MKLGIYLIISKNNLYERLREEDLSNYFWSNVVFID